MHTIRFFQALTSGSHDDLISRAYHLLGMPGNIADGMLDILLTWQERSIDRAKLKEISDHILQDIGISRADALREACKPFWRA